MFAETEELAPETLCRVESPRATLWERKGRPQASALDAIELLPDNLLYETDFPHPTSISPGAFPFSESARDNLERKFAGPRVSQDSLRKVLHNNAARVYHLT